MEGLIGRGRNEEGGNGAENSHDAPVVFGDLLTPGAELSHSSVTAEDSEWFGVQ